MKKLTPLLALTFFLSACQGNLYSWGGYESGLLGYYKAPSDDAWTKDLQTTVADAEKNVDHAKAHKVAPGLYAEYGYMLMKRGGAKEAVPYFRKERAAWPESAVFMTALEKASEGKKLFDQPAAPQETTLSAEPSEAKPAESKSVEAKPAADAATTPSTPSAAKPAEAAPAAPQPSHEKTK